MKNLYLLISIILLLFTSCRKNSKEIKKDAEKFLQSVREQKKINNSFFQLLGVQDSSQSTLLKIGEPVPVTLFEFKDLEDFDTFKNKIENLNTTYSIVPFILNKIEVSQGYFSQLREVSLCVPIFITPTCGSILRPSHLSTGSGIPLAVNPYSIYSDFKSVNIGVYKYNDEFYGISLRDSFFSEKEKAYQLKNGKSYTLQTIQQILKKNLVENKEND